MLNEQVRSPLNTAIACALLQPALRSLLIFDAPFAGLQQIAQQMIEIAAATGQKLRPVVLSSTASDDDLWGESILPNMHGKVESHKQIFAAPHDSEENLLIIIPDLSGLGLAAARASVMLVGANVAHLERHGQQDRWSPRYYWLAGCRQEIVGSVSPHLLDRFVLRFSWQSTEALSSPHLERVRALRRNLQHERPEPLPLFDPETMQQIKQTVQHPPLVEITEEACKHITTYQDGNIIHQRRELALAHCSLALAQIAGDTQLHISHIQRAAKLMGLQKQNVDREEEDNSLPPIIPEPSSPTTNYKDKNSTTVPQNSTAPSDTPQQNSLEVQTQEPRIEQTVDYVQTATNPYPEDTEPILREAASLQIPQRHLLRVRSDRGPVIGVEASTTLRDLSLIHTLMRALLFQTFRTKQASGEIVLDWTDLRKYRRAAVPERLLLLLLDYTCLPLAQRQQVLVPYLSQAYIERAGITIVKVGVASAEKQYQLQAESVSARNILVPAISDAIDAPAGSATPLAHGLELALQIMRRALQQGRNTVHHITFVVVSDGRGNVPLKASHSNTITLPVSRAGLEDALRQAREIGKLKHVTSVVITPKVRYYQDLPQQLANALHAPLKLAGEEGELQ